MHKDVKLTEVDVADKLLEFRSKQAGFLDTSFDTISGTSSFSAFLQMAACSKQALLVSVLQLQCSLL